MRVITVINLKGGVAKTTSAVNMSDVFANELGKKVLLIDNDKQGNASKMFGLHGYGHEGTAEVMTDRYVDMHRVIQKTQYENIDIITANMNLLTANLKVMLDQTRPQQTRFQKALKQVEKEYDFCIIDNAPDINISTINGLVAADDVLVPLTIDEFSIDGLAELKEQVENTKEDLNENLNFMGCFVTQFEKSNEADVQGEDYIRELGYPLFETKIHRTPKMKQSTFAKEPISVYSPRCRASRDYSLLVEEYLKKVPEADTTGKGE